VSSAIIEVVKGALFACIVSDISFTLVIEYVLKKYNGKDCPNFTFSIFDVHLYIASYCVRYLLAYNHFRVC
jgi:hypothetical protein